MTTTATWKPMLNCLALLYERMQMGAVPAAPRVAYTKSRSHPHLRFEWHADEGKVYAVVLPGKWVGGRFHPSLTTLTAEGKCVAEHCENAAQFMGSVQTYLRGYHHGQLHTVELHRLTLTNPDEVPTCRRSI